MSEKVRDLVAVSLKNPVKIFISSNTDVAQGLEQQFVRIREGREGDREAIVAALLTRYFPKVLGLRFFRYQLLIWLSTTVKIFSNFLSLNLEHCGIYSQFGHTKNFQ